MPSPNPRDPLRKQRNLRELKWNSKGGFHKNFKILLRVRLPKSSLKYLHTVL